MEKIRLEEFFGFILLSLVLLQVISYVITKWFFPNLPQLKLGFGFFLLIMAIAIIVPFQLIIKRGGSLEKRDILALIIYAAIIIGILIIFPKLAPEIFQYHLSIIRMSII